jgi:hypothetical protein
VHLAGGQVGGGELADQEVVIGLAVGQVRGGDGPAGSGQVFVREEARELAVGGNHVLADGGLALGAQPCLLGRGDAVGNLEEGLVERTLRGIVHDLGLDLAGHPFHQHPRRGVAGRHAGTHQFGGLRDHLRHRAQTRDPVAVILGIGERQYLGDALGVLHAAALAHRPLPLAVLLAFDRTLELPCEHVVAQAVLLRQRAPVDRAQLRQRVPVGLLARTDRIDREVAPAIVVAPVAAVAGGFRTLAQPALPLLVEQLVQGRGGVMRLRDGRRRSQRQHCGQQHPEQARTGRERGESQASGHGRRAPVVKRRS